MQSINPHQSSPETILFNILNNEAENKAEYQTYLLQLISVQIWHVNGALPTLECDQNTLLSEVFNLRDVEAH